MYSSIIVPIDPWGNDLRIIPLAASVARRCTAPVRLLTCMPGADRLQDGYDELRTIADDLDVDASIEVHGKIGWKSEGLVSIVQDDPGALVCMPSRGRPRTGSLLGSVAEAILREAKGPVLLVGPKCERFSVDDGDTMIIAVDGSAAADEVIGLGGSWAITFGLDPWIVSNVDAGPLATAEELNRPNVLRHHASELRVHIGRGVEWKVLHGRAPAEALTSFARDVDATVIATGTHTGTGLSRLAVGSVCASTVHRAPCPVLVHRTLG